MQLETNNLILTNLTVDDAAFILYLVNTPGWLKNIGNRNVYSVEDAVNYLVKGPMSSYEKNGFGLMLVKLKKDNVPVGICGLIKRDTLNDPDIGFALAPEYEGKGYAHEAAAATIALARQLGIPKVAAIVLEANTKSTKLLTKLGMTLAGPIQIPGDDEELMLYSISL